MCRMSKRPPSTPELIQDLIDTFGETFVDRLTYRDYDRVFSILKWSESTFIRVLKYYGIAVGDLETRRIRRIQGERLREVLGDEGFEHLSYRDYDRVNKLLGWSQSTFRTALGHLGRDGGNLRTPRRTYIPTDDEIETLERIVSRTLVRTLLITGCRFGELWRMDLHDDELTIYTEKGGPKVTMVLTGMERSAVEDISSWVEYGSKTLSYDAARKRWQRCVNAGEVSSKCQPHNFRHRAATLYDEAGLDTVAIAEMLGHSSLASTKRYKHSKNGKRAANILIPRKDRKVEVDA